MIEDDYEDYDRADLTTDAMNELHDEIDALREQRDELLEACEKALKEMRDFGNITNWPFEMPYSYLLNVLVSPQVKKTLLTIF